MTLDAPAGMLDTAAMDQDRLDHLHENAQRAFAWKQYVEDHGITELEPGSAERAYEQSMLALAGELEQQAMELTDNLDSKDWYRPAADERFLVREPERDQGIER